MMGYEVDIEDMDAELGGGSTNRDIRIKNKALNSVAKVAQEENSSSKNLPGAQKVWMKTFGCSHNVRFYVLI